MTTKIIQPIKNTLNISTFMEVGFIKGLLHYTAVILARSATKLSNLAAYHSIHTETSFYTDQTPHWNH